MRPVLSGVRAVLEEWRLCVLVWMITAVFAALVIAPAAGVLRADLGHSLYAFRMFDTFDAGYLAELRNHTAPWLAALTPLAAIAAAAFLAVATFLNGGILRRFSKAPGFWAGCADNFWRLCRLLLLCLVCYGLLWALNAGLGKAGDRIWGEGMEERPVVIFEWCRAAFMLALVLFVNMVSDYAKIRLVFEGRRDAARVLLDSFAFAAKNFRRCSVTYALIAAGAVALTGAGHVFVAALPRNALGWILLLVLVQQGFVLLRAGIRLLFFASQAEVYRGLTRSTMGA